MHTGLLPYAGVVGVDHYWTHQGMPCKGGEPQEFAMQDALTLKWKAKFPDLRMLQYATLRSTNMLHGMLTSWLPGTSLAVSARLPPLFERYPRSTHARTRTHTHAHACMRAHAHAHAHARTHTRAHTHRRCYYHVCRVLARL